jgi:hypothetical protein
MLKVLLRLRPSFTVVSCACTLCSVSAVIGLLLPYMLILRTIYLYACQSTTAAAAVTVVVCSAAAQVVVLVAQCLPK